MDQTYTPEASSKNKDPKPCMRCGVRSQHKELAKTTDQIILVYVPRKQTLLSLLQAPLQDYGISSEQ